MKEQESVNEFNTSKLREQPHFILFMKFFSWPFPGQIHTEQINTWNVDLGHS